jgi:hypothetical protein
MGYERKVKTELSFGFHVYIGASGLATTEKPSRARDVDRIKNIFIATRIFNH